MNSVTAIHFEALFVVAQTVVAPGTVENQYYMITAIGALTAVIVYLHKSNQKAAEVLAAANKIQFEQFVEHHKELIAKVDEERGAMTIERIARINMLMNLVKDNALATQAQANATDNLAEMIKERIAPLDTDKQ